jgi:hypothetical protein
MQKKIDINELDIPQDDIEAWERYPKYHWVYDVSRLLDAQHIKWSPFRTPELDAKIINMKLESKNLVSYEPSVIFVKAPEGTELVSEAYITKGEIKLLRHIDKQTREEIDGIVGEVELRLNAFVTLHLQKFTGVISVNSIGPDMYQMRLRPFSELSIDTNTEVVKLKKRIYKKLDMHVSGPTAQVFRESIAS